MKRLKITHDLIHRLVLDTKRGLGKCFAVGTRESTKEPRLLLVLRRSSEVALQMDGAIHNLGEATLEFSRGHRVRLFNSMGKPIHLRLTHVFVSAGLVQQKLKSFAERVHVAVFESGFDEDDVVPICQRRSGEAFGKLDEDLLSFDVCFGDVTEIGLEGMHDEVLDTSSAIVNRDEVDDLAMVFSILVG